MPIPLPNSQRTGRTIAARGTGERWGLANGRAGHSNRRTMAGSFRFEGFELDPGNRRLSRDGAPVELSARYLDALVLLAGEQGRLVSKDRFLEEVWRGIPVTDEALTQCIKTLRRQLGDDAANPRFIETVPKHGYRFLAPVEVAGGRAARPRAIGARAAAAVAAGSRARRGGHRRRRGGGPDRRAAVRVCGRLAARAAGVGALSVMLVRGRGDAGRRAWSARPA